MLETLCVALYISHQCHDSQISPERFSIWTMRSDWHNLPTIGGRVQGDGKQYAPAGVTLLQDGNVYGIELELSPAYPGGGFSYTRRVALDRNKRLTVVDHYEGSEPAVRETERQRDRDRERENKKTNQ